MKAYGVFAVVGLVGASPALANDELLKLTQDPNQQVLQTVDYANTRYSKSTS
jgi:hypothetical protein